MSTRTITIEISEDVARSLDLLPNGAAAALVGLANSAAEGMRRPEEIEADRRAAMRLRCKVYTNPHNGRRYLVGGGFISDDDARMLMFAMNDDGFLQVDLSVDEYNDLPFFTFAEEGPAPRRASVVPVPWRPLRAEGN